MSIQYATQKSGRSRIAHILLNGKTIHIVKSNGGLQLVIPGYESQMAICNVCQKRMDKNGKTATIAS